MFAVPMLALGAAPVVPRTPGLAPEIGPVEIIDRVVGLIWWVILAASSLLVIIAAFFFLTSAGDGEKIEKARGFLLAAVLGIVVGAAARGLAGLVTARFMGP